MANIADYSRSYNIYDSIRQSARSRRQAGSTLVNYGATVTEMPMVGTSIGVKSGQVGMPTSSFLTDVYAETPTGVAQMTPAQIEAGMTITSDVLTPGEAAISQGTPYGIEKYTDRTVGELGNALLAALDISPFGFGSSFMGGTVVDDPYGRPTAVPGGFFGFVAEMNIEKQYEVAEQIKAGTPGFHQFYQGQNIVSIVPQSVMGYQLGYTTIGTTTGTPQDVINQYAAMYGMDPATVDLSKRPEEKGFGTPLEGFVRGSGGFNRQGDFVGYNGRVTDLSVNALEAHIGLVNTLQGPNAAINALTTSNISKDVKGEMMDAVQRGELTAKEVRDADGNLLGFETGLGSVVRSTSGSIVTSTPGIPVTSGAGIIGAQGVLGYNPSGLSGFSMSRSSDQYGLGSYGGSGEGGDGFGDYGGIEGVESTDQSPGAGTGEDSGTAVAKTGGFISKDRAGMQEGGVPPEAVPPGNAPVAARAGFVGQEPEGVPDGETVADDVPVEVPEGTFVINAAAVEFAGSDDIKKMILEAMEEAEKQGIDIQQENTTIPKEDLVSLVVSKGEVIVPPQLAEVIGYDRLNKINNRGKAEVERRSQEAEQQEAPAPKPPILAKSGGFISKPA